MSGEGWLTIAMKVSGKAVVGEIHWIYLTTQDGEQWQNHGIPDPKNVIRHPGGADCILGDGLDPKDTCRSLILYARFFYTKLHQIYLSTHIIYP